MCEVRSDKAHACLVAAGRASHSGCGGKGLRPCGAPDPLDGSPHFADEILLWEPRSRWRGRNRRRQPGGADLLAFPGQIGVDSVDDEDDIVPVCIKPKRWPRRCGDRGFGPSVIAEHETVVRAP